MTQRGMSSFSLSVLVKDEELQTQCTLEGQFTHAFDPFQSVFSANVAYATQGNTVPREVLGSGNATLPNQRFTLKRCPLTYVPPVISEGTETVTEANSGAESEIEIRVDGGAFGSQRFRTDAAESTSIGLIWKEIDLLSKAGPRDRVYMLVQNEEGKTEVVSEMVSMELVCPPGRRMLWCLTVLGVARKAM